MSVMGRSKIIKRKCKGKEEIDKELKEIEEQMKKVSYERTGGAVRRAEVEFD